MLLHNVFRVAEVLMSSFPGNFWGVNVLERSADVRVSAKKV